MDIGPEKKRVTVEPVEDPFRRPVPPPPNHPGPVPDPAAPTPIKEPA